MSNHINLVKLCVGAERVEDLIDWQSRRMAETGAPTPSHLTRMWPRRSDDLLGGGSLYWVFKGAILARQKVLRLDERRGEDGINRCAIVLDPRVIRTEPAPRRPFQGWRYLTPADAPRDLARARSTEPGLPPTLAAALADLGVR